MRICLLGPTHPYRGGISHYTTILCRELRGEHDVEFISFRRQYPDWLYPGATDRDNSRETLEVRHVQYLLDPLNPLTWRRTAEAVCAFRPDVFLVPWWVAFWALPFRSVCKRVRRTCDPEIVFLCHNVVEHESNRLKSWLTRRVLGLGDRHLVHSREDERNLLALLPDASVTVGFHPTYEGLAREQVPVAEARRRLGLKGPVILFFGFVRPYKGLDVLLEALPAIRRATGATLLVVGESWKDRQAYADQIARLELQDAVHHVDRYVPNEELPVYFGASDLVVLPYRSGTGSGVAQLAFGFERPVVATTVGCLPEVVLDDVDGRLVAPEKPDDLARAVVEGLEPATLSRLQDGARRARGRFSWQCLVDLLVSDPAAD